MNTQNSFPVGVSEHDPAHVALADVDAARPEALQAGRLGVLAPRAQAEVQAGRAGRALTPAASGQ